MSPLILLEKQHSRRLRDEEDNVNPLYGIFCFIIYRHSEFLSGIYKHLKKYILYKINFKFPLNR